MRKAFGVSIFVLGALLAGVSARASLKSSFTTAITGSTTASVKSGSVTVTLCTTNNGVSTCAGLSSPVASTCPVITLKQGPQTIKASCGTAFLPTAFTAAITVNGTACSTYSGLIGGTASCKGVTVKVGR
jgi:hypothetical protein